MSSFILKVKKIKKSIYLRNINLFNFLYFNTIFFYGVFMNERLILSIQLEMEPYLDQKQSTMLNKVLFKSFKNIEIVQKNISGQKFEEYENKKLLDAFISSKRVEGCSEKTLKYYRTTIDAMASSLGKNVRHILTEDLRACHT